MHDSHMLEKLKSRKFWAAVVGAALVAVADQLGIDADAAWRMVSVITAYIGGQSVVDALAARAGKG